MERTVQAELLQIHTARRVPHYIHHHPAVPAASQQAAVPARTAPAETASAYAVLAIGCALAVAIVRFARKEELRAAHSTRTGRLWGAIKWTILLFLKIPFIPFKVLIGRCWYCGEWGHHASGCRKRYTCWACGQPGHFAAFCPNRQWL